MKQPRTITLMVIFLLCLVFRLVPYALDNLGYSTAQYPWNFSPILPLCLFGGAFFSEKWTSFAVPIAAWFVGDLGIWILTGRLDYAFYGGSQVFVYLSILMVIALGFLLRGERSFWNVAGTGLLGAVLYFVVTNFAVWFFGQGMRYPHTPFGLWQCYVAAIPYFRYSLLSMAVFLPILFSPLAVVESETSAEQKVAAQAG